MPDLAENPRVLSELPLKRGELQPDLRENRPKLAG
jgi:hypothetical protein